MRIVLLSQNLLRVKKKKVIKIEKRIAISRYLMILSSNLLIPIQKQNLKLKLKVSPKQPKE
jgi:hypothetical protein